MCFFYRGSLWFGGLWNKKRMPKKPAKYVSFVSPSVPSAESVPSAGFEGSVIPVEMMPDCLLAWVTITRIHSNFSFS